MLLEMLGATLIIPVLACVLNINKYLDSSLVQFLIYIFKIDDYRDLIYLALVTLILVYLIKAMYLNWLSLIQAKYVFNLQANISCRLFSLYVIQPFSFHLQRNSAYLIRNVTTETQQLVESAFLPLMLIINEAIVIAGLIILMILITPIKAMILLCTILLGVLTVQLLTKNLLFKLGHIRQANEGLKIKAAQEGLGGIKEIKLLGREKDVLKKFAMFVNSVAIASAKRYSVQQYPRIWIEFLGVAALISLIILDLLKGMNAVDIIPDVAFIGMISFRMLPSCNRLVSAIQSINFSLPVIMLVKEELKLEGSNSTFCYKNFNNFSKEIKLNDVSFYYEINRPIINHVFLDIKKGQKIGIIGTSGAGKSTFVDLILGLHVPKTGTIKVDGLDIAGNLRGWQAILGYVPQSIYLSDDTLKSNVAFGVPDSDINIDDVLYALKLAHLDNYVSELSEGIETILGERGVRLSGGQRQRIGIARALYRRPKLLVLDEATSALDTEIEKEVMKSIYSLDDSITIIIVAHRLSTLDGCDKIITLSNGNLYNYEC